MRLESRLEDFSQYLVITYNGKDSEKEYYIYIYIYIYIHIHTYMYRLPSWLRR